MLISFENESSHTNDSHKKFLCPIFHFSQKPHCLIIFLENKNILLPSFLFLPERCCDALSLTSRDYEIYFSVWQNKSYSLLLRLWKPVHEILDRVFHMPDEQNSAYFQKLLTKNHVKIYILALCIQQCKTNMLWKTQRWLEE